MTIPEDVREAMRQALEFCAGDYCMTGDRYDHFEAALAWLDAQPEAPQTMPEEERVTIPEDVRGWIESAAQVASDSARYYDADSSSSDAVLAWLDAQPAAPERWEPVGDGCHGMTESVLAWQDDDAGGLWRAVHVDDTGREETGKFYDWLSAFRWINERRTRDRSDAASIQDEPPHTQPEAPATSERWRQVRELQSLRCPVREDEPGDWHIDVSVIGELLVMDAHIKLDSDVPLDVRLAAKLLPDLKLFRRVPSQPEAPEASCPRCGEMVYAEEETRYYGDFDAVGERVTMYRCDKCGGLWGLGLCRLVEVTE